jgi:hypothetical protein
MNDSKRRFPWETLSYRARTILFVAIAAVIGFLLGSCKPPRLVIKEVERPTIKVEKHEVSRIMLPFYEADVENCNPTDFGRGATLMKDANSTLEYALRGLQWCGVDKDVTIDIQGFSSKRAFKCDRPELIDHLNLQLAEARRTAVINHVRQYLADNAAKQPGSIVNIAPSEKGARWVGENDQERLSRMRNELAFADRIDDREGKTPETFTRRVDIVVTGKGRCELDNATEAGLANASSALEGEQ